MYGGSVGQLELTDKGHGQIFGSNDGPRIVHLTR